MISYWSERLKNNRYNIINNNPEFAENVINSRINSNVEQITDYFQHRNGLNDYETEYGSLKINVGNNTYNAKILNILTDIIKGKQIGVTFNNQNVENKLQINTTSDFRNTILGRTLTYVLKNQFNETDLGMIGYEQYLNHMFQNVTGYYLRHNQINFKGLFKKNETFLTRRPYTITTKSNNEKIKTFIDNISDFTLFKDNEFDYYADNYFNKLKNSVTGTTDNFKNNTGEGQFSTLKFLLDRNTYKSDNNASYNVESQDLSSNNINNNNILKDYKDDEVNDNETDNLFTWVNKSNYSLNENSLLNKTSKFFINNDIIDHNVKSFNGTP